MLKECPVFGQGEGFDVQQSIEQARAETGGGFELGGPGGAPLLVIGGRVGHQERGGFGWQAIPMFLEEAGQMGAVEVAEVFGFREEF